MKAWGALILIYFAIASSAFAQDYVKSQKKYKISSYHSQPSLDGIEIDLYSDSSYIKSIWSGVLGGSVVPNDEKGRFKRKESLLFLFNNNYNASGDTVIYKMHNGCIMFHIQDTSDSIPLCQSKH